MEQECERNGFMSLDPMYYWKYVMKKGSRTRPEVRLIDAEVEVETIAKLAYYNPNIIFRVETENNLGGLPVHQENVHYVWRGIMSEKERLNALNNTDYVIYKDDNLYGLEAELCGAERIEISDVNEKLTVLNSVERIENWEKAKKVLT